MRADRGGLWELADIARRDRGLFPEAGPDLPERLRDALGVLDLRARDVRVERRWSGGGLDGEELSWTVGFGPRTRARLLRPGGVAGPLPGVLAAHCHAGMKWAGKDKIADGPEPPAPEVARLRDRLYWRTGPAWWPRGRRLRGWSSTPPRTRSSPRQA